MNRLPFKTGDKVIRFQGGNYNSYGVMEGKTYTVSSCKDRYTVELLGIEDSWDPNNFKLVEPEQVTKYQEIASGYPIC